MARKKNNTNLQDQICIQLLLLGKSHSNLTVCGKLLISRVDEKMKYKFLWTQQCRHLIKTGSLSTQDFSLSKDRKKKRNQPFWTPENTEVDHGICIKQIPVRRLLLNTFIIIPWETVDPQTSTDQGSRSPFAKLRVWMSVLQHQQQLQKDCDAKKGGDGWRGNFPEAGR